MTPRTTSHILDLNEAANRPVSKVGRKAHTQAVLRAAGFSVPDGVVIPVDVPADRELLEDVARRLDGPLAVRSSAVAEDTDARSFAGQYETVLWVEGLDGLAEATERVRASGASERVRSYAGSEDTSGVAVLIQEMVPADAAGVAFTADPVTGDREVSLVSSVRGVGERLVSGEADPDEWEVRAGEVTARRTPEESLTDDQVREVAELAGRVATELGAPQDIEWAIADGELWLLQARPITGLPDIQPIEPVIEAPGEGFWMLDGGHYPSPVSPMGASFYLPALEEQASAAFREWGFLLERVAQAVVGWRVYIQVQPPPGEEAFGRQLARAEETFESGRMEDMVDRWWDEWRSDFRQEIAELAAIDLAAIDDEALVAHLEQCLDLVQRGQRAHFDLAVPYMVRVAETMRFCIERLGWSDTKATELFAGLSEMSAEPARRLVELAKLARERPAVTELLEAGGEVSLNELRAADQTFADALDAYLAEFGMRATAYDVIAPTVGEQEEALVAAIRGDGDYDPEAMARQHAETRKGAIAEARALLADDGDALQEFDQLVEGLERVHPMREDNIFFTDNAPVGLVRLAALEIGRRLTDRGLLADPEHVVFLTIDEAVSSLTEGRDHRQVVERRRGERAWAETHSPAPSFGEPAPPPDPSGLPAPAARLMGAMGFFMQYDLSAPLGDGLTGSPASAGAYTGPVRVVRSESEFGKVRTGDVLVCPITTPAWSVLFGRIGALVTDTGGLLSHSAIVAREHGLPAVVAAGTATSELRDGQIVTVDGTTGQIEIEH